MRHATCRQALLDGDLRAEVAEHLDQCEPCRAFARDLAQVGEYAAEMSPGPAPDGLADRVIAHVRAGEASVPIELAPARSRRGVDSRRRLAALAVAAAMILLVGVLAAFPRGDDPSDVATAEIKPILAAAERTLDTGTARIRINGTATATITPATRIVTPDISLPPVAGYEPPPFVLPPEPDYAQFPPEQQAEMRAQYEASVEEARRHYDAAAEEFRQQYEAHRSQAEDAVTGLTTPGEFSFEMSIEAQGAIAFPDRMRLDGHMVVQGTSLPIAPSGVFGVAVDGGTTYLLSGLLSGVLSEDGAWLRTPAVGGPLQPLLADPDGVLQLIAGARGEVEDLGEEELGGFRVRHYRFTTEAALFGPVGDGSTASGRVDAWVGVETRLVHKLVSTAESDYSGGGGFRSRMTTSMTMELYDFGATVDIAAPTAAGSSTAGLGAAAVLTPFDPAMATAFFYAP